MDSEIPTRVTQEDSTLVRVAEVVFDRPLRNPFSYLIPSSLNLLPGQRVKVPLGFGNKAAIGFCIGFNNIPPSEKLKSIQSILDPAPLLSNHLLNFTQWIADYYHCGWGQVLQAVIPAGAREQKERQKTWGLQVLPGGIGEIEINALTPLQKRILAFLQDQGPAPAARIAIELPCTPGAIKRLLDKGVIGKIALEEPPAPKEAPQPLPTPLELTAEQSLACQKISQAIQEGGFKPFLIHGVTGSGKTEIYLRSIAEIVASGKQALVLLPEISLTPQTVERFRQRFSKVVVLHSHLRESERGRNWKAVARGEGQVVIGARSAVFAPLSNPGIIIVDEEHENSFKQDKTPRYHGRDIAVVRARMLGIPILLGSATPSLESWNNASKGNYQLLTLPKRVENQTLPEVFVVDMSSHPPATPATRDILSDLLFREMKKTLENKGQVILFLNRRGFHTWIRCPACGSISTCTRCDLAMTFHKGANFLLCHHCGLEREPDQRCGKCASPTMEFRGAGTEKLEEEISRLFPNKVIRRMDSDSTRKPGAHEKILGAFKEGLIHILIGTQMIAKGLDFPNVRLVGVINPDFGLHIPDFRAGERTFQLLSQVAGRAGRGKNPGRVFIQTYFPQHPAIQLAAKHDYLHFAEGELNHRKLHYFPPFARLARIVIRSKKPEAAEKTADQLSSAFRNFATENPPKGRLKILGPAQAPVFKLNELHRYHIQIHCDNHHYLHQLLWESLGPLKPSNSVEWIIDIDPCNLL
ncbi:MAG: primosomal protein N' [Gemmataceae bacterium]|nr:primosomal protein N' [Gemmataceae bacterium]